MQQNERAWECRTTAEIRMRPVFSQTEIRIRLVILVSRSKQRGRDDHHRMVCRASAVTLVVTTMSAF
eukprot:225033-Rhodomonas_salina.13